MHRYLKITMLVLSGTLVTGCFFKPSRSYDNTAENFQILPPDAVNIDRIKPITGIVSAQKPWQNSGVFIQRGDTVVVKAHGKWSPWAAVGVWTGPEGSDLYATEVPYISGSALMARVGHKGKPFKIGIGTSFRSRDYGMLYMAMNDSFKNLFDNDGKVEFEIYIDTRIAGGTSNGDQHVTPVKVTAYNYDDTTGKGYISVATGGQDFAARQWVMNKIGEIASTKNVAIDARRNRSKGGSYRVTNEKSENGVLSIQFETIW